MGRMHSPGKGISGSTIPYKRTAAAWVNAKSADLKDQVCRLAKKGLAPSQIGALLRDQHGVPRVKAVTGTKVLRILKKAGASHAVLSI